MNLFVVAADKPTKARINVAEDGFPTGQSTPEGAAADLARALIERNVKALSQTCVGLYAGHKGPAAYATFLENKIREMKQPKSRTSPTWPTKIIQVYAARHLRRNGPASYGYAGFNFQDVMFVDVMVELRNGQRVMNRTLVIQEPDLHWYAHPAPHVDPLLSFGLDDESASTRDFSDAYER